MWLGIDSKEHLHRTAEGNHARTSGRAVPPEMFATMNTSAFLSGLRPDQPRKEGADTRLALTGTVLPEPYLKAKTA